MEIIWLNRNIHCGTLSTISRWWYILTQTHWNDDGLYIQIAVPMSLTILLGEPTYTVCSIKGTGLSRVFYVKVSTFREQNCGIICKVFARALPGSLDSYFGAIFRSVFWNSFSICFSIRKKGDFSFHLSTYACTTLWVIVTNCYRFVSICRKIWNVTFIFQLPLVWESLRAHSA